MSDQFRARILTDKIVKVVVAGFWYRMLRIGIVAQ